MSCLTHENGEQKRQHTSYLPIVSLFILKIQCWYSASVTSILNRERPISNILNFYKYLKTVQHIVNKSNQEIIVPWSLPRLATNQFKNWKMKILKYCSFLLVAFVLRYLSYSLVSTLMPFTFNNISLLIWKVLEKFIKVCRENYLTVM